MTDQSNFPDSWTRDCPSKGTRVEISVFDATEITEGQFSETGLDWIEIPTSSVELWEKKTNSPHIKKTAKLTFPTEWDGGDVRSVVKGYGNDAVTFGRVWLKDSTESSQDSEGTWVLNHCGIVAGVGGTDNSLESKAWIYDMTYAFDAIGVTQSYTQPTVENVLQDVGNRIGDTYVPLTDIVILPPDGEAAFLQGVDQLDGIDRRQGSSYYGYDVSEDDSGLDSTEIRQLEVETGFDVPLPDLLTESFTDIYYKDFLGLEKTPLEYLASITATAIYNNTSLGTKKFTRNHDTVGDVLNWLSTKTGLQWHFEPTQNGVVLVITNGPMRRTFVQDGVVSDLQSGTVDPQSFQTRPEYRAHETVTVRNNQALYEIAPANTVILKGDTKKSLLEGNFSLEGVGESLYDGFRPDTFPVAKARAVPLVEAAGGTELPLEIESDASSLSEAKAEAITSLQDHLNQSSEGNIVLDGSPRMLPFDVLDAYETCQDYVTEQIPVRYEVDEIKHTDTMTTTLETELNVQAFVGEEQIEFDVDATGMRGQTTDKFIAEETQT